VTEREVGLEEEDEPEVRVGCVDADVAVEATTDVAVEATTEVADDVRADPVVTVLLSMQRPKPLQTPTEQVPQSSADPQPSLKGPHCLPWSGQVWG
jgi:hypothetical protein